MNHLHPEEEKHGLSSEKKRGILNLPQEDTTWTITLDHTTLDSEDSDSEAEVVPMSVISVVDKMGRYLGTSSRPQSQASNIMQRLGPLLIQCMFSPLYWKPRRPRFITTNFSCSLQETGLTECGVKILGEVTAAKYDQTYGELVGSDLEKDMCEEVNNRSEGVMSRPEEVMRSCIMCQRRGSSQLFITCEACRAVFYCCCRCDVENKETHSNWCDKLKGMIDTSSLLVDRFFSFTPETSHETFTNNHFGAFLSRHELLGCGFWQREYHTPNMGLALQFGELDFSGVDNPYIVPEEGRALIGPTSLSPPAPHLPLASWKDYYSWRGFQPSSPIAILLQCPLTLYYTLTTHLPQLVAGDAALDQPLVIHVVGVEKEADYAPVFQELGNLLPQHTFELHLCGPSISKRATGKLHSGRNISVTCHSGLYHRLSCTLQRPSLVFGFNAGIGAYHTWSSTLLAIKELGEPAFFTDYSQYSLSHTELILSSQSIAITNAEVNPFRSPIRKYSSEQRIPAYSNAWLFQLKFRT